MKDYGLGAVNSFLLSLLLYFCLLFFLLVKIGSEEKSIKYTDLKDSFIDVDLGVFSTKSQTQDNKQENSVEKKEEVAKETTNKELVTKDIKQEQSDINSLFGNLKDFKEEKNTKIQSSQKSSDKTSSLKDPASVLKELNDNLLPTNEDIGESSNAQITGVYDEFRGKLRRILEQRWRLYEANGNFKVLIKYTIDSNGKFSYTHIQKSYDESFDAKVLEFLNNLNGKFIAYPPRNEAFHGDMELSDKIKENV